VDETIVATASFGAVKLVGLRAVSKDFSASSALACGKSVLNVSSMLPIICGILSRRSSVSLTVFFLRSLCDFH